MLGRNGRPGFAVAWLIGASLFFYGWWNPSYLILLVSSVLFNYSIGVRLIHRRERGAGDGLTLAIGVAANLTLLGYFKYTNFLLDNLHAITDSGPQLAPIVLPLAISFFTFQQIAYLVDAHKGEVVQHDFIHYCLFVMFFSGYSDMAIGLARIFGIYLPANFNSPYKATNIIDF